MALILPGGIIGGRLPASIAWVDRTYLTSGSGATTTMSSLDFGAAVSGANQKWAIVSMMALNDSTVTVSGMSVGGETGSIVYQQTQAAQAGTFYGTSSFIVWTARIDAVTTGDVVFTDDTAATIPVSVSYVVNIDASAVVDSDKGTGANNVTLGIDCPAKGLVFAHSYFFYSGGGSPSGWGNANLDLLDYAGTSFRHVTSGTIFSGAQTGLDVSTQYTPNGARPGGFAISFAGL